MYYIYHFVNVNLSLSFYSLSFYSSKNNNKTEDEGNDEETQVKTVENGAACENLDGVYNMSFSDNERLTQM